MTFTLRAACGRLTLPAPAPRPLLAIPPQEGDRDSLGNCKHLPIYLDGTFCQRCGQDVVRMERTA